MAQRHPLDDEDEGLLTPAEQRLVNAISTRVRKHPPQCLLGLDETTVLSLKEIAEGYRTGKSKALGLMLRLVLFGVVLGAVTALAQMDIRAVLRSFFGMTP